MEEENKRLSSDYSEFSPGTSIDKEEDSSISPGRESRPVSILLTGEPGDETVEIERLRIPSDRSPSNVDSSEGIGDMSSSGSFHTLALPDAQSERVRSKRALVQQHSLPQSSPPRSPSRAEKVRLVSGSSDSYKYDSTAGISSASDQGSSCYRCPLCKRQCMPEGDAFDPETCADCQKLPRHQPLVVEEGEMERKPDSWDRIEPRSYSTPPPARPAADPPAEVEDPAGHSGTFKAVAGVTGLVVVALVAVAIYFGIKGSGDSVTGNATDTEVFPLHPILRPH